MTLAILTDIEGTTTPISFVTQVLYPFARDRLPAVVWERAEEPEVARIVAEVQAESGQPLDLGGVVAQMLAWMDEDRKAAPLKDLQGIIWEQGYREGSLQTQMYDDAARWLKRWHAAGMRLYVFSSGSVQAQRSIFAYTDHGDLEKLFSGFFDTRVGQKRESGSYRRIADSIGLSPGDILFLSDVREELDAARRAGMQTAWLVRGRVPPGPAAAHRQARRFDTVPRSARRSLVGART
jgi:enolase-phosphatase E1